MKPWQAASEALKSGSDISSLESFEEEIFEIEEICIPNWQKLIHHHFPHTYADEISQADGEIHVQEHNPKVRPEEISNQIVALDEQIMWSLKPLEEKLERLYILRDLRNELYYLIDSEEK